MLVQVQVHECPRPPVCVSVGSVCRQMFVCLPVELFYGKTFPCCLGLVCAGAILSRSRDCNEQLAAHQALSLGPGFPGRSLRPVYVWGVQPGAGECFGLWEGGWSSQLCALCKWRTLASAGRICTRPAASKPPGPTKLSYWPPVSVVPLLARAR